MSEVKIVTYEEVKAMADEPEKLLVDVRNPDELQEVGKIPHSLNIPCKFICDEHFVAMKLINY